MKRNTAVKMLGASLVGTGAIILASKARFENTINNRIDNLRKAANPIRSQVFSRDDLEGLPAPVQRYFNNVLIDGQPYVESVQLRQQGEFRLDDTEDSWKPLDATQHFTVDPPGFVWDARIEMVPFISARVLDMYQRGEGILRAKVLSTVPVAEVGPNPEMNSGKLLRYLAESVWFPTALLPSQGVEWDTIDRRSARATLENAGATASLVFYFNDRDEVEKVHTERRYRQEDRSYRPWTGYFDNYQVKNGLRIPVDVKVEWNLPNRNAAYWRASIEEIDHKLVSESSNR
ncbi:DUF6920 family protein [Haladaptatus sp. DFWS20]|uniref:DUF6920 family protein n=1 Tax=Haladaptatus sp. DFWS20 TaxID=3403467 RepID=UPI003EBCA282